MINSISALLIKSLYSNTEPETFMYFFIDCNVVKSICDQTLNYINKKQKQISMPINLIKCSVFGR